MARSSLRWVVGGSRESRLRGTSCAVRAARNELRGTFHVLLLRALSGIEGEFEGENVAGSSLRRAVGGFFF